MLYLSKHFHQKTRQWPHYIFYFIEHFLISLHSNFVLLLLCCKDY